jgi:hypothetical protein
MKQFFETSMGIAFVLLFLLIYFPGGTIFMAVMCPSQRLDGLDWVLSVIIPGFGLIRGATC